MSYLSEVYLTLSDADLALRWLTLTSGRGSEGEPAVRSSVELGDIAAG